MSRYENEPRGRSNQTWGRNPDYFASENVSVASPGYTTYNGRPSQARLTYEPHTPFYKPQSPSALQIPKARERPRSLPPPIEYTRSRSRDAERERGYNKYGDSDDSDDGRPRSPIEKAKRAVGNSFTDSPTGIGVGMLGALVGGLVAREAVDATSRHNSNHHNDPEYKRNQLISTVVGAAVGALGANAVEKRIENTRGKDRVDQDRWERKWKPRTKVLEKREVIARPRSGGSGSGSGPHYHTRSRDPVPRDDFRESRGPGKGHGRGLEREVDPDARSWKNVEDWLYDDQPGNVGGRPMSCGGKSFDSYRS